jgi:hypothetical protein
MTIQYPWAAALGLMDDLCRSGWLVWLAPLDHVRERAGRMLGAAV